MSGRFSEIARRPPVQAFHRERQVTAAAVRVVGLIVVLAAALTAPGQHLAPIGVVGAIAGAASLADWMWPRRYLLVAVVESMGAAALAVAVGGTTPTDVYMLVPPMTAGVAVGLGSAVMASLSQALVVAAAVVTGVGGGVHESASWVVTGLTVGAIGALLGGWVSVAVRRVGAAAAFSERRRLAAEIHDGFGQELAVLGYRVDRLLLDNPETVSAESVRALGDELRRTLHDARWTIHDLRGGRLPEVGFGTALADHVRRAADLSGLTAHLSITESADRLSVAEETELLRIAQEAVTNVRKHAGADNIWVTLELAGSSALLVVADDGVAAKQHPDGSLPSGFGLAIMQERAATIGADFHYRHRSGGGTVIEVRLAAGPRGLLPVMGRRRVAEAG